MAMRSQALDWRPIRIGMVAIAIGVAVVEVHRRFPLEFPRAVAEVEIVPFVVPPEIGRLFEVARSRPAIEGELKIAGRPPLGLGEQDWKNLLEVLGTETIAKFEGARAVYRIRIANRARVADENVRLAAKDAIAYYRKVGRDFIPLAQDSAGYIRLTRVDPGDNPEILAFAGSYSAYDGGRAVFAQSDAGEIPVHFLTLKPSLATQLRESFLSFALALVFIAAIAVAAFGFLAARRRHEQES